MDPCPEDRPHTKSNNIFEVQAIPPQRSAAIGWIDARLVPADQQKWPGFPAIYIKILCDPVIAVLPSWLAAALTYLFSCRKTTGRLLRKRKSAINSNFKDSPA
jgi:hypothetical protein